VDVQLVELTEHESYELFRSAIVAGDALAWATIYTRYRSLMIAWAAQASAKVAIHESYENLAAQAFVRAWVALMPEHVSQFPTLASLLAYLHRCLLATVIDCARALAARERGRHKLEVRATATPKQIVMDAQERRELWQLVCAVADTAQERTVLVERFVLALPPRTIQGRQTDLFADVAAVYCAKRNLLTRLQHRGALQRLRQEPACGRADT
jgi:DNA-directed RNA polymerase specialized sigma24 family protein